MKSTGEVMGIDKDFDIAFSKGLLGSGMVLPDSGTAFVSVKDADKDNIIPAVEKLVELGFAIIATGGTAAHLQAKGLAGRNDQQGRPRTAAYRRPLARRRSRPGVQHDRGLAVAEGQPFDPRHHAGRKVPYFTTAAASVAAARAIEAARGHALEVASLQSYYSASGN